MLPDESGSDRIHEPLLKHSMDGFPDNVRPCEHEKRTSAPRLVFKGETDPLFGTPGTPQSTSDRMQRTKKLKKPVKTEKKVTAAASSTRHTEHSSSAKPPIE